MNDPLLTEAEFRERNNISRTSEYYLEVLGRGPDWIYIGTKKVLSLEAEAAWRREMQANPVRGDLRKMAEAAKNARSVEVA
jgi:hypothetical protein